MSELNYQVYGFFGPNTMAQFCQDGRFTIARQKRPGGIESDEIQVVFVPIGQVEIYHNGQRVGSFQLGPVSAPS